MEVAVENGGYVTPALAAPFGVPAIELRKMVSRHVLSRVAHGVYRVPSLPFDRYDEFILARLWCKSRGVISHDSALLVHGLCDINPTKIHITIPTSYRIAREGSEGYIIHRADLPTADIVNLDGVVLTGIRRTLIDSLHAVPRYLVEQAIDTAEGRGAMREHEAALFRKDIAAP